MKLIKTPRESGSLRVQHSLDPESLTEQGHKDQCNINSILKRVARQGMAPIAEGMGKFGDFSEIGEFHDVQDRILDAHAQFGALPASIRKRFDNDPGQLVDFMADPSNEDEARKLGLLPEFDIPTPIDAHLEQPNTPETSTEAPAKEG